jgi:methionyl-tRNA synthetase
VQAEAEGITAIELGERNHAKFLETWDRLGISFDLFTKTSTENHRAVAHDFFTKLLEQGDVYLADDTGMYCETDRRFLPDRYVEGACPHCGYTRARGDQCENCGRQLDPADLVGIRCRNCGSTPVVRTTQHFFMRLTRWNQPLLEWAEKQEHWRLNVRNFTLRYLREGLKDRAITRDMEHGVTVPVPGYEGKRIYVWFEAVMGYLSASKEWAQRQGEPEAWRRWWQQDSRSFYFMGKDNIPFHTIIWPAMLMAYGGLNLPYDVPANEFMNLEGDKISSSRNWAVWTLDFLDRYDADSLRYYLAAGMPETSDADFSWREYLRRNNDELVATYGNLANRVLTITRRNFDAAVPVRGDLRPADRGLLDAMDAAFAEADAAIGACRFRDGLRAAMSLAQAANKYLDDQAPWKAIREDKAAAGHALHVCLQVLSGLATLMEPYMPASSHRLSAMLGFGAPHAAFSARAVPAGQVLPEPAPLFTKRDESIVAEEQQRLGVPR